LGTAWKENPNTLYFNNLTGDRAGDNINDYLQVPNAEYPLGYIEFPEDSVVWLSGYVSHDYPISHTGNISFKGRGTGPTEDGLSFTGVTGMGPVSKGEDAGLYVKNGIVSISNCSTVVSASPGIPVITGVIFENCTTLFDTSGSGYPKAYRFDDNTTIKANGDTFLVFQDSPVSFNNMTSSSSVSIEGINNFTNTLNNFPLTSGDIFDLTGLDIIDPAQGVVSVSVDGCLANMEDPNWVFIRVTDDDTIHDGIISNNKLEASSTGAFINLDVKSINTVFSGNSENIGNTDRKGAILTQDNTQETANPGVIDEPVQLEVNNADGATTNSSWEVNVDGSLEYINPNASYSGDFVWPFVLTKIGGGTNEAVVYIYKQSPGGSWGVLSDGSQEEKTGRLTIESNDEVSGSIAFPVVAEFGDKFRLYGSVNSTNDDLLLIGQQGVVS